MSNSAYWGCCSIGLDTVCRFQGKIPVEFRPGAGVSDGNIDQIEVLTGNKVAHHSFFISQADKDVGFVQMRLAD